MPRLLKRSDRKYQKLRRYVLTMEPLCRPCTKEGRITVATEVDHIQELRHGGEMMDIDNLQPICKPCHDAKTYSRPRQGAGYADDGSPLGGW